MTAAYRAVASVFLLAGFYLVALAQLGAAVALVIWLSTVIAGAVAVKLTLPLFVATVGAVGTALWKAIRTRPEPVPGLTVGPDQAPQLWAALHELAAVVRTRVPDEIRIVPEVNAAVSEESKLLGLIGGRRTLYIGLPLLQTLSVDQLRSVLAHELGHYSGRHTRLGAVAYRGRLAIGGTINRIGRHNPVGWVFRGYARLYLLVDHAVARRQELAADQASVQVAGRAVAASALRELPTLSAAWGFYFRRYVEPGWETGYAPEDLFGGFAELVAGRKEELDELRQREPESGGSRWDTHPPIGQRIAAMAVAPEQPVSRDERPATVLLPDVVAVGRRLQALLLDVGQRQVLPWPEFTAAMVGAGLQRRCDLVFRAAARFTGTEQAGLVTILDLVRAGRLGDFAEQFYSDATKREAVERFTEPMETMLQLAAVASGAARWRHSWSGPAEFVGPDGEPLSLERVAALAVSPDTLDEALAELRQMGIDPAKAVLVQQRATAAGANLIAALANVKVDGVEHDLLVLDRGLVFVPDPGKADKGRSRLEELVGSAPVVELARRHPFLPFEEVASVAIDKRVPTRARLTLHNGTTLALQEEWSSELLEKQSRNTLLEVLDSLAER